MNERGRHKLREDLVVRRRIFAGQVTYVVKDPIRLEYCTVDETSWLLLSMCDGQRDLGELTELAQKFFPDAGFDALGLLGFLENYRQAHFFEDAWERNIMLLERRRTDRSRALKKAMANPLEIALPAWDPNEFFGRVVGPLSFLWTRWAMLGYVVTFLAALYITVTNADDFVLTGGSLLFIPGAPLLGVAVLWFVLLLTVVLHEFGHGLTCKFYGGAVHRLGVLFLYFNPCLYCDVTEAYFFQDKKHKHHVTLAGGIVDLMTAAIATFFWYLTPQDWFWSQVAHRVAIFNGVTGILVNFNPLMKYDGYYLLSDELEIPNLRGDSFRYLGTRIKSFFGLPHEEELVTPRERRIFLIYGGLALLYAIFVLLFIFLFVSGWLVGEFRAVGWVLAGGLFFMITRKYWLGLLGFGRFVALDKKAHLQRWRLAYGGGALALLLAFVLLPLPRHVHGEVELAPAGYQVVRAQAAGILDEVLVGEGDHLEAGQPALQLREWRTEAQLREARGGEAQGLRQGSAALAGGDLGLARAFGANAAAHASRGDELSRQLEWLTVRAPGEGTVLTPYLAEQRGRFCQPGDTLFEMGRLDRLEAEVLVDEQLVGMLEEDAPVQLRLRARPGERVEARITGIAPAPVDQGLRRYFRVRLVVDDPPAWLAPGLDGRARLDAGAVPAVVHLGHRLLRQLRIDFWI